MAGINGIKALFSGKQMANIFNEFQNQVHSESLLKLQYVGEEFVNKARISGNYTDRTGNLRSSIGYIILFDGEIIENNFQGNKEGTSKGFEIATEIANQYPNGYVLIGVAGMNYAAAVEAKNYDVITGSAPEINFLKEVLNEI